MSDELITSDEPIGTSLLALLKSMNNSISKISDTLTEQNATISVLQQVVAILVVGASPEQRQVVAMQMDKMSQNLRRGMGQKEPHEQVRFMRAALFADDLGRVAEAGRGDEEVRELGGKLGRLEADQAAFRAEMREWMDRLDKAVARVGTNVRPMDGSGQVAGAEASAAS